MDSINDVLDWEPLNYYSCLIEATAKSLLEKVVNKKKRGCSLLRGTDFTFVEVGGSEADIVLDDWKLQERRILSLKYITSCKKAASEDDIPPSKPVLNVPAGYHNPKFIDRKTTVAPKPPPPQQRASLSDITPIGPAMKVCLSSAFLISLKNVYIRFL